MSFVSLWFIDGLLSDYCPSAWWTRSHQFPPFRLGSSEKLAEAARAAGMEAGVQEIPVEVLAPTQDSALEGMRATSVTQLILGALSETEQTRLEAAMRAEMETFRERDGYRFRGLALLLQGRKPAPTS